MDLYSTHHWSFLFSDTIPCFQEHKFLPALLNNSNFVCPTSNYFKIFVFLISNHLIHFFLQQILLFYYLLVIFKSFFIFYLTQMLLVCLAVCLSQPATEVLAGKRAPGNSYLKMSSFRFSAFSQTTRIPSFFFHLQSMLLAYIHERANCWYQMPFNPIK